MSRTMGKYDFGFRVALLVLCALCEASIAFFCIRMRRLLCVHLTSASWKERRASWSCSVVSSGTARTVWKARTGFLLQRNTRQNLAFPEPEPFPITHMLIPNPASYLQTVVGALLRYIYATVVTDSFRSLSHLFLLFLVRSAKKNSLVLGSL